MHVELAAGCFGTQAWLAPQPPVLSRQVSATRSQGGVEGAAADGGQLPIASGGAPSTHEICLTGGATKSVHPETSNGGAPEQSMLPRAHAIGVAPQVPETSPHVQAPHAGGPAGPSKYRTGASPPAHGAAWESELDHAWSAARTA